ncbi:MAG: serine/threonine protein phosphatase [Phycisphaeraceae bacterium]|nr:serine/threonine protein phosphatase [Phycisphaeraceae bacterium]
MKFLLSGDLHLGRASTRVPDDTDRAIVRAASTWNRLVEMAVDQRVRAVCLSGDIADQDNRFWESIGPLERGLRRLESEHIRVIAVAGNHDHDVLGRLADQLDPKTFTLLGRGGQWQRITIEDEGRPALNLDGWSFPGAQVRRDPLDDYDLPPDLQAPTLGIVHGDLDARETDYAPLDRARLAAIPVSGWLLGHVHAPRLLAGNVGPWILYPGSPQSLDPGETGLHGAWITELDAATLTVPVQLAASSVWYDRTEVDVTDLADTPQIEAALLEAIRGASERIADEGGAQLAHIVLRVRVTGRTAAADQIREIAKTAISDLSLPAGAASVSVDAIDFETMPPLDLETCAGERSAPGEVARLLEALDREDGGEELAALLRDVQRRMEEVDGHRDFALLSRPGAPPDRARRALARQAKTLLGQLLATSP